MKELVSVIVPVKNAENYLDTCLDSIRNQSWRNLEILTVDDGSEDASLKICEKWAQKDKRIKVLCSRGKGVVCARNLGISHASGTYLTFVDADDWLDTDAVERLMGETEGADLVCMGFHKHYESMDCEMVDIYNAIPAGRYEGNCGMRYIWSNMLYFMDTARQGVRSSMCVKLFRRSIVERFYAKINPEIFSGEDAVFVYWYLLFCSSVRILEEAHYHYLIRTKSSVHSVNKYFLKNIHDLYIQLEQAFSEHAAKDVLIPQLEKRVRLMIDDALSFRLGFAYSDSYRYMLPYTDSETEGKKLILYGAGRVGCDYYRQLQKRESCELVFWGDKSYQYLEKDAVTGDAGTIGKLPDSAYDFIIIAAGEAALSQQMYADLTESGVKITKIVWKEPIQR